MSSEDQIIADNQLQQHPQRPQQHQIPQHPPHPQHQIQQVQQSPQPQADTPTRKLRRACTACHTGKTRCSETLPCQNCLKRGLGNVCAYPDPDAEPQHDRATAAPESTPTTATTTTFAHPAPPPVYAPSLQAGMTLNHQQYYDYNGTLTGASSSTFRPAKRPRNLTEEETAAITRNFSRGDFFVGNSAPVRIDPRLPVRLTLGEGDHVHFNVGNYEGGP
ncbi:hypothetical protein MSAN_02243900 [Mycena sanguinolenta]|uniref:Zn(2)-C6 fungal-type domain-containing protein n=1 Tax=Mycena sanguinolenta TaxID=230812 RepID=A0A8H7CHC9_9AGAR|nr:hypothetical protein MSAN_02243900 [Mycena sanguinolenta]